METTNDKRGAYITGLRKLADLLESTSDATVPLPHTGTVSEFSIFAKSREEVLTYRGLMTVWRHEIQENNTTYGFRLHGHINGLAVVVYADLAVVARQTGTKTVPVYEYDPELVTA